MLFYPVKYHPPATASSVIRGIKPNRRAACIDRCTAKRPEHTGDKVSPRGVRAAPPPGGLARTFIRTRKCPLPSQPIDSADEPDYDAGVTAAHPRNRTGVITLGERRTAAFY